MKLISGVLAAFSLALVISIGALYQPQTVKVVKAVAPQRAVTIYITNHAPGFISDRTIRHDIPAWEQAANRDLAPVWHTQQVRLRLVAQAPAGALQAVFKKSGPVQGALAFHEVSRGSPAIVVYAGTDDYYGYSNSVSFTHELFELLADPSISITNQGYSYPDFYLGQTAVPMLPGTVWANEVCDAVEAYQYRIHGVAISDFVTPNWFNDHIGGGYDHMGVVQQPFTITRGGYSQFWDGAQWNVVSNFRHAGRDAAGFLKGERGERR